MLSYIWAALVCYAYDVKRINETSTANGPLKIRNVTIRFCMCSKHSTTPIGFRRVGLVLYSCYIIYFHRDKPVPKTKTFHWSFIRSHDALCYERPNTLIWWPTRPYLHIRRVYKDVFEDSDFSRCRVCDVLYIYI